MRVLVLGNDTPVGYSLSAFANPLRRHELLGVSLDKTRWGRERQVRRLIRDAAPDVVLDTRIVTQIDSSDRIGQRDVQRSAWLAQACERVGASYLYLSSAFVFSGTMTRPYLEKDMPDGESGGGRARAGGAAMERSGWRRDGGERACPRPVAWRAALPVW